MKRRINWTAIIVIVLFTAILAVTVFGLRLWRKSLTARNSLQTGLTAYDQRQWTQAVKDFGRYLAANPEDVPILYKYAESRLKTRPLKREDIQQAIAAYRSILRIDNNNPVAVEHLVNLYLQLQIASEGELIARQYLASHSHPQIRTLLAICLTRQNKSAEACEALLALMEQHPDQIAAYEMLAGLTEQHPELLPGPVDQWYQKAVSNNPESASALICRALYRLRQKQTEPAVNDLETAAHLAIASAGVRLQLARAFASIGRFEQARTQLEQVLSEDPANLTLWETWADVAIAADAPDEMEYVAVTGIEKLDPDMWDFLPTAGELLIRCGRYDRAEHWIQTLHKNDFDPVVIYKLQGLLAEAQQDPYAAIKCWTQATQAGDESEAVCVSLASAYQTVGDTESAHLLLRELMSRRPDSVQGRLLLAQILSQNGRWEEAAELARRATQLAPDNVDAALLQARIRLHRLDFSPTEANEGLLNRLEQDLSALEGVSADPFAARSLQLELALRRERFDTAEQIVDTLKQQKPGTAEATLAECRLRVAQDNVPEAITLLHEAAARFPQDVSILENLAYLLAQQGAVNECETLLLQSIQTVEHPVAKRRLALFTVALLNQWQQPEKAQQLLVEMTQRLPQDIPLKRTLLKYLRADGNARTVQDIVDQIKKIEGPDGWQWRYEQAHAWFTSDNFQALFPQIISLLRENLVFNPADQQSRMLLATTYEKAGNLQLALTTCKEAVSRSPEDIRIILPALSIMHKAGEYDTADKILTRIASQKLFRPEIARLELQRSLRKGNLQSAETIISEMAARDPDDAELALSLALLQIRLQKFDAAQNLLHHLRTVQPDSIPVAAALTELQIRQTDYDAALRICDEMVQKHANTAAYILRGQTFVAAGQIERAQKDFDQAVVLEPDNPRTWLAASEFNRITDRIEQAISAMDKALALDPDNFDMQKRMIALLLSSTQPNRVQRAEQLLETTRSAAPSDTELQLYQIRCLLLKNDPPAIENAQQMLLTVTEEHPKMIVAWVLLSDIYLNQGMVGKAMETVLQGLAYGPTSTPLLLVKARIEASQSPATALSTLTLLHEREPDNSDIVLELAKTYTAAQQYEDSIRLTETYLEQNADTANDNIRLQHAIALSRNGQPQQSQQVFDALYQTSPDTSMVLFAETDLLIANRQWNALEARLTPRFEGLGHHADADVIIRKLLENAEAPSLALAEKLITGMLKQNPDSPEANKAMALLLQIKGATAKSAELYSRVLENNPDDLIAINNLAWILCEQQGDYQKALKLAEHGLRKTPDYPDLIDTRGMIYYRMSEYQKALRDFSRCAEMYPDNSAAMGVTHFHLARAFAALEQPDRAIENLKQCLDFNQKYGGLSGSESEEAQGLLDTLSQKGKRATYAY